MIQVKKSEATAALRRVFFHCVDATDGITPETGEDGGQPQMSIGGGAWGNTDDTLHAIGNGRYYITLSAGSGNDEANQTDGTVLEFRYKSANTAEAVGTTVQIVECHVGTIKGYVDDVESRLTATRAGYLDNLSAGAAALEATLTSIKGSGWASGTDTLEKIRDAVDTRKADELVIGPSVL